jgi:hypothetical protein
MTDPLLCTWCSRRFTPRQTGGRDQRFCRPSCRRALHAAARGWMLSELAAGRLTVGHIRKGSPATCALPGDGLSLAPVFEEGKAAALLGELLAVLPDGVWQGLPDDMLDKLNAYWGEPILRQ